MTQTLIRVGHSAYKGTNAIRMCFSKAQAVRVLRNRGVTRNAARDAVNKAMRDMGATANVNQSSDHVEVVNLENAVREGHYDYARCMSSWSAAPEL